MHSKSKVVLDDCLDLGWLVGFYGISTTMGYLMPNLVHIY